MDDDKEFEELIKERFAQLPKVVQDAIVSADIEKHMRDLAETSKLHLDQYKSLENEVRMTLLGVQPVEDLEKNIKSEVGVNDETAKALAESVSKIVFEPIRQEMERQLEHPDAKAVQTSGVETAGNQAIAAETKMAAPVVAPATPPAPANQEKAVRAPISESYQSGQASKDRKEVHDDPYREPPA